MNDLELMEEALFDKWDETAAGEESPALFLVNSQADGLGSMGDSAEGYSGHCRYRLPPGWQPRDVAAALANLVLDLADRESWPREKLIGLVMDECVQASMNLAVLGSDEEARQHDQLMAGMEAMSEMFTERPDLALYLHDKIKKKDR